MLNDLLMHVGFYLTLNLSLALIALHAPLGQEPGVVQANQDETRDPCLLTISALQSHRPALVTSN
jgi:hypothetical protein